MARRELPLPYIPIDPLIEESQRFVDFVEQADIHDDAHALMYIVRLLLFAGRSRVDGNLGHLSPRQMRKECRWPHDPELLVKALETSGWLVKSGEGYVIEGWDRHGGQVLKKREGYRSRQKKRRQNKPLENVTRDISVTYP